MLEFEAFGNREQSHHMDEYIVNLQQIESGHNLLSPLLTLASWGWITSWSGWRITFSAAGRGISPDPPRGKTGGMVDGATKFFQRRPQSSLVNEKEKLLE